LSLSPSQLTNKIKRVIENKEVIDSLYVGYLSLIEKSKDFSITGSIDEDKINEVLKLFSSPNNISH